MEIVQTRLDDLRPYEGNPRKNDHAVEQAAAAIREFGFRVPIIAKEDGTIVDGHLRYKAAKHLGMDTVPVVLADGLTETQIKAFRLSVNKMAELAEWDEDLLQVELQELQELDFDLELIGFSPPEVDSGGEDPGDEGIDYQEKYAVLVECKGEREQAETYDRLVGIGLQCKVLVN